MGANGCNLILVVGGKGMDECGVTGDYSEWVVDGTILELPSLVGRQFVRWKIYNEVGVLIREKDWGVNEGLPVYPDKVRVPFGKSNYVEVGYTRRRDGTFYATVCESFHRAAHRQRQAYESSRLYQRIQDIKKCKGWDSLCDGIHLSDEAKMAYKAAIDEASSGRYEGIEFIREEI